MYLNLTSKSCLSLTICSIKDFCQTGSPIFLVTAPLNCFTILPNVGATCGRPLSSGKIITIMWTWFGIITYECIDTFLYVLFHISNSSITIFPACDSGRFLGRTQFAPTRCQENFSTSKLFCQKYSFRFSVHIVTKYAPGEL